MRQTGSTKLLYAAEIAPLAKLVEDPEYPIRKEVIPSFEEMMTSSPPHYPYTKTFEEAKNDPIVVLHSSGSTGRARAPAWKTGAIALSRRKQEPRRPSR